MDLPYDARVAGAMNRVLEAERAAQSAIADCERKVQALLEQARQRRRTILERAHDRIMALHSRATRSLERQTAHILGRPREASHPALVQGAEDARLHAALERLVERLTGASEDEL
jgi:vacuolar-type H+-ATPase subunit H